MTAAKIIIALCTAFNVLAGTALLYLWIAGSRLARWGVLSATTGIIIAGAWWLLR